KGSLRLEITAKGKMAHSAYPQLGDSAIEKLLTALEKLRAMKLPVHKDKGIGPCTVNIGLIEGGRAPNVIADHAKAHLLYRLVGPSEPFREQITEAVGDLVKTDFVLDIPFVELSAPNGMPTMVAAFTTDIPALTNWGKPLLFGPGTIHVAHTENEHLAKKDLFDAIDTYVKLATSSL